MAVPLGGALLGIIGAPLAIPVAAAVLLLIKDRCIRASIGPSTKPTTVQRLRLDRRRAEHPRSLYTHDIS
ncbi:hypothetical protein ACQPW1_25960 [Nocardia sp. CA-128927]|uniref:hypothetical protein n=1 Tax=Nocardia sp. CA-128927 TaxID=3239975 RepID=UPI003D963B8F